MKFPFLHGKGIVWIFCMGMDISWNESATDMQSYELGNNFFDMLSLSSNWLIHEMLLAYSQGIRHYETCIPRINNVMDKPSTRYLFYMAPTII